MISAHFLKNKMKFLPLLALPILAWLLPPNGATEEDFSPEKINLALRRTADGLLRAAGDSTSRIPAVEQTAANAWQLRLDRDSFRYDLLPGLLQAALEVHGIRRPYQVAVRCCADETIDLGFHQTDFTENQSVPCATRALPEGCHFIEITFLGDGPKQGAWASKAAVICLFLAGMGAFWFFQRQKRTPAAVGDERALRFGNSRLDVAGQVLICGDLRQTLTFREAKLLRFFAERPDQLLERDAIVREVWADEGVLVGRSVDMFVSRLRKKLAADPSVAIVAVHGVGYRLTVLG